MFTLEIPIYIFKHLNLNHFSLYLWETLGMAYCMGGYCCTKHFVYIRNDSVSGSQSTELDMIYLKNTTRSLIMSSPNRSEGWHEERNLLNCGTGSSCLLCYTHKVLCILWGRCSGHCSSSKFSSLMLSHSL